MKTILQKLISIALLVPALAFAWEPTKPIEVIIAHTPGTVNEVVFRALAKEVEQNTKANFIVLNRPGVGGAIGTAETARKPADGYNANMISIPGLAAIDKIAMPKKEYGTDSFEYPFDAAQSPFAIVTHPKNPNDTPQKWIDSLKTMQVSISANGGARLVYEQLNVKLNLKEGNDGVVRVDHKSPVEALTDVAGGSVNYAIVPISVANTFAQGGKVKIIAVTSAKRIAQYPDTPTLNTVVPNFVVLANWGLVLPKGTPKEIVDWYNVEFTKALNSDSVRTLYAKNFLEQTAYTTPKSYEAFVKAQEKQFQPLVDAVISKMNK